MKTPLTSLALCGLLSAAHAQLPTATQPAASAPYAVVGRGPSYRVMAQVSTVTNRFGLIHYRTNAAYTELAAGLHYQDGSGAWRESRGDFQVQADGTAVAAECSHPVIIAANLNDPSGVVVDLLSPEGKRLRSAIWALGLFDSASGRSLQIAAVRDSQGTQTAPNEITFFDCFDGVRATVRYRNDRGQFHQEVLLHQKLSEPQLQALGFSTQSRIEVWSRFMGEDQRSVFSAAATTAQGDSAAPGSGGPAPNSPAPDLGSMTLGQGTAFVESEPQNAAPVTNEWLEQEGDSYLVESCQYSDLLPLLSALPEFSMSTIDTLKGKTASQGRLVAHRAPPDRARKYEIAKASGGKPGGPAVVWDYVANFGGATNYVFNSGETYFISGPFSLWGTNVLMGGSVLKSATTGLLSCSGQFGPLRIETRAAAYRPVVWTAKDDDSAGARIDGSTGWPLPYDGAIYGSGVGLQELSHIHFRYAKRAVNLMGGSFMAYHSQFVNCDTAVELTGGTAWLRNCLMVNSRTNFILRGGANIDAQNVTFNGSTTLAHDIYDYNNNSGVILTNCLLANVTNLTSGYLSLTGDHNGFYASPQFGSNQTATNGTPFLTVGAGSAYLTESSPFRGAGAIGIDAQLLADLKLRTTWPPQVICTQSVRLNTTLSPQALRGGSPPDLGFAYDPIDYAICGVFVTNATLTIAPGTVIATFGIGPYTYGLGVGGLGSVVCEGSPLDRNRVVAFNTVQESADSAWKKPTYASFTDAMQGTPSQVRFRFTDWSSLAWDIPHVSLANYQPPGFVDCQFFGGQVLNLGGALRATNSLFEFADIEIDFSDGGFSVLQNNLFRGGRVSLFAWDDALVVADNLFDGATIPNWGLSGYQGGFNAYVTNAYAPNEYRLQPAKTNDIILLSSPTYQAGPLGNYYQLTNSVLINADTNTTAGQVGLFHYTVCTNTLDGVQISETNSWLDVGLHYPALEASGNLADSCASDHIVRAIEA